MIELAGATAPKDQPADGVSYVSLLTGAAEKLARTDLFWHFPGYLGAGKDEWRTTPVSVVRSGDWKLLEFLEDGRTELYNLADDIGEQHDLAESNSQQLQTLKQLLTKWREQIGAKLPQPRSS